MFSTGMPFVVRSGVRQGGILSPILFNVYVNDLVNNLVDKDCGCHVGLVFFGCFIYTDDIYTDWSASNA